MHGGLEFWFGGRAECFNFIADRILLFPLSSFPPSLVDQLALCSGHEPGGWIRGNSGFRPRRQCGGEGFLQCVFGAVERSGEADRSEERRVGKGCRSGGAPSQER